MSALLFCIKHVPVLERRDNAPDYQHLKRKERKKFAGEKRARFSLPLSLYRFWTTRIGSDAAKYRMQRPISAVAHMCTTVSSCSPSPLLPNPLIDRAPPILRGRDPRASFPHLHRRLNRNVSSHLFQSRDIHTYIHINNISVKETNSTSSSLLPRSHLKGPPLNRSDPWNYLYSFFFFSFLISTLKTDRYRHASGGRPNDATRHDTARHEATHIHIHTCAQGWNIGARGSGRARWCRFLRGIVRGTGRDAPGSESTTPLNPCKRSLRRTIIKVYTHPRRIHRKGAGCCIQGAADSRRTRFRTSDDGARP